jgi:hypothetical protein
MSFLPIWKRWLPYAIDAPGPRHSRITAHCSHCGLGCCRGPLLRSRELPAFKSSPRVDAGSFVPLRRPLPFAPTPPPPAALARTLPWSRAPRGPRRPAGAARRALAPRAVRRKQQGWRAGGGDPPPAPPSPPPPPGSSRITRPQCGAGAPPHTCPRTAALRLSTGPGEWGRPPPPTPSFFLRGRGISPAQPPPPSSPFLGPGLKLEA